MPTKMCQLCFHDFEISEEEIEEKEELKMLLFCKECEMEYKSLLLSEVSKHQSITEEEFVEKGVKLIENLIERNLEKTMDELIQQKVLKKVSIDGIINYEKGINFENYHKNK